MLTEKKQIPFARQVYDEGVLQNLYDCLEKGEYERGAYTKQATNLLKEITNCEHVLLTNSCTAALEMSALLHDIGPGDEVIMPSFTFVSTANAFVLRGAIPVFVDINPDNLNMNESLIEKAITTKTRAIVPVHYAGTSCDLNRVKIIARKYNLLLIEDAAQCIGATYKSVHLGTFGSLGALSFHYTKNISAGFGGALLINDSSLFNKAKIILQRGTNRDAFLEGAVDKYTWTNVGSSYVLPEISSALLVYQLSNMKLINEIRTRQWERYFEALKFLENKGFIKLPRIHNFSKHNGHIFYFLLKREKRIRLIEFMRKNNIQLTSHYQPLHKSDFFQNNYGTTSLPVTEQVSKEIVRLPLYATLSSEEQDFVIEKIFSFFE